jgi:Cd2+/Zn2+-exporting ATPase
MQERWAVLTVTFAWLALMIGFFGEKFLSLPASVALGFYVLSYLAGGYDAARTALPALFLGKSGIDLLMIAAAAGAAGAAVLGEWAEGAFLLFLFALGHAGENYAMDRARNAVGVLGELMPRTAFTKRGDRLEEVPVERNPDDEVFAGTINQDNALEVCMTRLARDNTLARVIQLVANGKASMDNFKLMAGN